MLDSEGTAGRSPSCGQQERQVGALVNSVDKSGAWWWWGARSSSTQLLGAVGPLAPGAAGTCAS